MSMNRECPDQTARMLTLIWTFTVRKWHEVLFSHIAHHILYDLFTLFSFDCFSTIAVGRLRTTLRVAQRFKERRRTEADITIHTKPSALLASEMVVRKMSQEELEISLTRTCRPTVSFLARTASNRRINASDIYVPPPYTRVQYFTVDSGRFKGQRPLTQKDKEKLIRRLSTYNPRRRPAESKRIMSNDTKRQLGPLGSYRWNGIRNC